MPYRCNRDKAIIEYALFRNRCNKFADLEAACSFLVGITVRRRNRVEIVLFVGVDGVDGVDGFVGRGTN